MHCCAVSVNSICWQHMYLHNINFPDDASFGWSWQPCYIMLLFNQNFLCSIEELQRLLKDKEAYNAFFNSLDQVKTQNNVSSVAQPLLYICDAGFTRGCWNPFCIITHILMACLERRNEKHRKGKAIGIGKKCSGKTDDWNTQFFYELEFGIQE